MMAVEGACCVDRGEYWYCDRRGAPYCGEGEGS